MNIVKHERSRRIFLRFNCVCAKKAVNPSLHRIAAPGAAPGELFVLRIKKEIAIDEKPKET